MVIVSAAPQQTTLTASVTKDGALYVAQCLEVDVASQGDSLDDALANLREALELHFEDGVAGLPLARPIIAPIDITLSR
jgi:predicted RNase H-like HicB family nuclease